MKIIASEILRNLRSTGGGSGGSGNDESEIILDEELENVLHEM